MSCSGSILFGVHADSAPTPVTLFSKRSVDASSSGPTQMIWLGKYCTPNLNPKHNCPPNPARQNHRHNDLWKPERIWEYCVLCWLISVAFSESTIEHAGTHVMVFNQKLSADVNPKPSGYQT